MDDQGQLENMLLNSNKKIEIIRNQLSQYEEFEKDVMKSSNLDLDSLGEKIRNYEELLTKKEILGSGKRIIELFELVHDKGTGNLIEDIIKFKEIVNNN